MWRGRLDPGYVLDLIHQLPQGNRTYAVLQRDEALRGHTFDRVLSIYTANLARLTLWVLTNQNRKRPTAKPDLIPVPGAKDEEQRKPNLLRDRLAAKRLAIEAAQRDAHNQMVLEDYQQGEG